MHVKVIDMINYDTSSAVKSAGQLNAIDVNQKSHDMSHHFSCTGPMVVMQGHE